MHKSLIFLLVPDPVQGNFMKFHFNSCGLRDVMLFQHPDECIYTIRKNAVPDFIIADASMNGLTAIEFLRTIKAGYHHIKVVFISECEDLTEMSALLDEGAADYIQRNGDNKNWIRELVSNIQYLIREQLTSR